MSAERLRDDEGQQLHPSSSSSSSTPYQNWEEGKEGGMQDKLSSLKRKNPLRASNTSTSHKTEQQLFTGREAILGVGGSSERIIAPATAPAGKMRSTSSSHAQLPRPSTHHGGGPEQEDGETPELDVLPNRNRQSNITSASTSSSSSSSSSNNSKNVQKERSQFRETTARERLPSSSDGGGSQLFPKNSPASRPTQSTPERSPTTPLSNRAISHSITATSSSSTVETSVAVSDSTSWMCNNPKCFQPQNKESDDYCASCATKKGRGGKRSEDQPILTSPGL